MEGGREADGEEREIEGDVAAQQRRTSLAIISEGRRGGQGMTRLDHKAA